MPSVTEPVPLRVGIVCDLLEERWPSMDLVAERLATGLRARNTRVEPVILRPAMYRRLTRLPGIGRYPRSVILDRLINRHVDYPGWLSRNRDSLDVYHVVDHSYAHLVTRLPPGRAVVTCHDLDTFRCLLAPDDEPRSILFRAMVGRTLRGLQRAARVICVSRAVKEDLVGEGLVDADRVRVVPNGVDPVFTPDPESKADEEAARLLDSQPTYAVNVLHVGSSIPRKRIDVLLNAFAQLAAARSDVRLVRVGGLTLEQRGLAHALGVGERVIELPFLDSAVLAAVYRRAAVTVVPSDREGFGLPVLESLACGVPVVASDIPALRETGGVATRYCRRGDAEAFARAVAEVLAAPPGRSSGEGRQHAARFSWSSCATGVEAVYREVAATTNGSPRSSPS